MSSALVFACGLKTLKSSYYIVNNLTKKSRSGMIWPWNEVTGYPRKTGGVCCGGFFIWTAQNVIFANWELMRSMRFLCIPAFDFLWFLSMTKFDLWSSLVGNSLTSFEKQSFSLQPNDRLIKVLVSDFGPYIPVSRLEPDISRIIAKIAISCTLDFPTIKFQIFCVVWATVGTFPHKFSYATVI